MLTDQPTALARIADLVDAELWRVDRRGVVLAVLHALVHRMDWESGLVAGVTRAHLAAAADCSVRTVSRVIAWAVEAELVVVVESGASAQFLGTERNRAPAYVLTTKVAGGGDDKAVERLGNPPACGGSGSSPQRNQGLKNRLDQTPWPLWEPAVAPTDRARAVDRLLDRTGLAARVVRWRAVAMLAPWFAEGWCVAGVLYALDHHPDQPERGRGDATRAARDPLRVIGHRLTPWRGREADLPAARRAVAAGPPPSIPPARETVAGPTGPPASSEVRAAARAELARVLSRPRSRPRGDGRHRGPGRW